MSPSKTTFSGGEGGFLSFFLQVLYVRNVSKPYGFFVFPRLFKINERTKETVFKRFARVLRHYSQSLSRGANIASVEANQNNHWNSYVFSGGFIEDSRYVRACVVKKRKISKRMSFDNTSNRRRKRITYRRCSSYGNRRDIRKNHITRFMVTFFFL